MGRLAEMAQTGHLKGPVHFVNLKGEHRTYNDEVEAEEALKGVSVEHRRGAFFETAGKAETKAEPAKPAPRASAPASRPSAPAPASRPEPKSKAEED
jgi:hypothetical protein